MKRFICFIAILLPIFFNVSYGFSYEENKKGKEFIPESFKLLVDKYLKPYSNGIYRKQLDKVEKKHANIGRYIVSNGSLYVRGKECKAISSLILNLLKSATLPDLDFLYLHATHALNEFNAPVFCQAKKSKLVSAIPFHDRMCFSSDDNNFYLNDWGNIFEIINNNQVSWDDRFDLLIWRGGGNDRGNDYTCNILKGPRGYLCYLSNLYPELIDAKFARLSSGIPQIKCNPRYKGSAMSKEEQIIYKFQIIMHGAGGTFPGTRWRLLSGSLCYFVDFKKLIAWYFPLLKPDIHFISINSSNLKNLPNLIKYYLDKGEHKAKEIAKNARNFALDYLSPDLYSLYCRLILERYAELYKDEIKLDNSYRNRTGFEKHKPKYF